MNQGVQKAKIILNFKIIEKNYTLSEKKKIKIITRKLFNLNYLNYFQKPPHELWKIFRIYKLYDETSLYLNFNLKVLTLLEVLISRSSELKILGPS